MNIYKTFLLGRRSVYYCLNEFDIVIDMGEYGLVLYAIVLEF